MEFITFLLLILLLVLPIYLLCHKTSRQKKIEQLIDKLPGPPKLPVLGTTLQFITAKREDFFKLFIGRNLTYGPVFRSWNGSIPVVHIMKPEHVELILSSTANLTKGEQYRFVRDWLGEGLITGGGQKWHDHRKLITPTFHFKILDNFTEVFAEKGQLLAEQLSAKADGKYFDIYPYVTHCALDIISKTAMGVEVDAMNNSHSEYVEAIYGVADLTVQRIYRPHLHSDFVYNLTENGRIKKKHLESLHGLTKKIIRERREKMRTEGENAVKISEEDLLMGKKKRLAFLDLLLQFNKKNNNFTLTDDDIREEVDTFMFAGHDTSTVSTCWTLFALSNFPEVQEKVHEELDEILQDNEPITVQNVSKMQYLERVVKETMRYFPIVPAITRTITSDVKIDKYDIPIGAMLAIHIYSLHRDPVQFPDPERFDPDRFLPERAAQRHPYSFIPFSAGPRNCLGQKFAMRNIKVLLASIMRRYNVKALLKIHEMEYYAEMVLRPQKGLMVALEERNQQQ